MEPMTSRLSFRWLGVQGIELRCDGQTLAIDPFFTRPPLRDFVLLRGVQPDQALAERLLPACRFVLVTHAHYDHVMDVPGIALRTGATICGSPNTGRIMELYGVPGDQFQPLETGRCLSLGPFEVEAVAGRHVRLPLDGLINGPLSTHLRPPLRLVDYRMDYPLGFFIRAAGVRILVCPAAGRPADVLLCGMDRTPEVYHRLLDESRPRLWVPLHWDNFFRALDLRPLRDPSERRGALRELRRPTGPGLKGLARLAAASEAHPQFLIPRLFEWVDLSYLSQDK